MLAALFMVICGLCQFVLKKNEFAVYHLWQNPGFKPKWQDISPLKRQGSELSFSSNNSSGYRLKRKRPLLQRQDTLSSVSEQIKENFRNTQGLLYALSFIIVNSLLLFPGATTDSYFTFIQRLQLSNPESWYQLLVVFIFNVFDTVGRWAGGQ